jgi:EAL domain-containing protein (putative c-di-GMP-specific phosphodiesterase class I)
MSEPALPISSVLVVDDSPAQRRHLAKLCRDLGIAEVREAGNGAEGLSILCSRTPPPDLLILDLEMPTMDGFQVLQQLEQRSIDVAILVASSREQSLLDLVSRMGRELGRVLGSLQKPVALATLSDMLHTFGKHLLAEPEEPEINLPPGDLATAIERNEIHAEYQPKVDVRTGVVRGVEALARWKHPTLGQVPPSAFVALAEKHGHIHDLTMRLMREVMLQSASWRSQGVQLTVAINLSPTLLDSPTLPDEISAMQQCYGLAPEQIVLEITESSVVSTGSVTLGVLARLRLKGFGLSLDDYGTGFSSLQQLTRIPFTELKIDRSFVHGAHERENLQVILRSALEMADRLRITSVAEGIETHADWRLLQELGCGLGQGYLISKPMAGAEMQAWLSGFRQRRAELQAASPGEPRISMAR